jgi:hypothetical protein
MRSPSINKPDVIGTAAVPARPVTCRHSDSFVQKEKLGPVASLHHRALTPLPVERAANPSVMRPAGSAQRLIIAVDDPAITDEITAGRINNYIAGWLHAVLKRHIPS